ncbi:MAG TPA: c-type cytochrome [Candidatus Limnocylindrales bacterium]|nr:c-type cytochrome [Candidatus Limnocylindrales bacterium]
MTGKRAADQGSTCPFERVYPAMPQNILILTTIVWILGFFIGQFQPIPEAAAQQAKESSPELYQKIYTGWKFWHVYCYRCHGVDALGSFLAPNLRESVKVLTDEEFFKTVKEGRVPKGMPAWATLLDDEKIRDVYLYVRARSEGILPPGRPDETQWDIPKNWPQGHVATKTSGAAGIAPAPETPAVKGDPAAGEKIFFDTQILGAEACANCHIAKEKGGEVGPVLSKIGRRSPDYIRESILKPSAVIVSGFETTVITTKDGRNITGIKKAEDDSSVELATADGKLQAIPKGEIQQTIISKTSLMPNNYSELLNEQQLNDLLAYLLTLR